MNLLFHLAPTGTCQASSLPSDMPFGAARQRSMTNALLQLERAARSSRVLRIDLPQPGEVRIRNLVHRGALRPVFKTTSVKLDRVVQCESALEHEASLLLDVIPAVQAFSEQPVRLHFPPEVMWISHIPDFAVLLADRLIFVEIKFEKDVDPEVKERTLYLERQLAALGADYRLITDRHLRQGDQAQNALRVLRRARHAISEIQLLATLEKLRVLERAALGAFGWSVPDSQEATSIARLIMSGYADFDTQGPLSDRTSVWLAQDAMCPRGVA